MKEQPIHPRVDWYDYARKYDMLLEYNPYYLEALREVARHMQEWEISEGGAIADVGGGTGNYSVKAAQMFPHACVLHIENNRGMNAVAMRKAARLPNFQLIARPAEAVQLDAGSLDGVLCINALYTFPQPQEMLKQINTWLASGKRAIFVDPGRVMNPLVWKSAISWHLLRKYGLKQTLHIFREAKAVAVQNAHIRKMQKSKLFWTHSHEEFCEAVRQAGFRINYSALCFRGDCDLVVAEKPKRLFGGQTNA